MIKRSEVRNGAIVGGLKKVKNALLCFEKKQK